MNRIDKYFEDLEKEINNLPLDINNIDFSKQRLEKLGIIYGTIAKINQIFGNESLLKGSVEYIRHITIEKIRNIINKDISDELLYKRTNEELKLNQIVKQPIEIELQETFYNILKLESTDKKKLLEINLDHLNKLKKIIQNTINFLPEDKGQEIKKLINQYNKYLKK